MATPLYTTDERIVYKFEMPSLEIQGLGLRIYSSLDEYLGRLAGPSRYNFYIEHEDGDDWKLTNSRRPKSPRFTHRR